MNIKCVMIVLDTKKMRKIYKPTEKLQDDHDMAYSRMRIRIGVQRFRLSNVVWYINIILF